MTWSEMGLLLYCIELNIYFLYKIQFKLSDWIFTIYFEFYFDSYVFNSFSVWKHIYISSTSSLGYIRPPLLPPIFFKAISEFKNFKNLYSQRIMIEYRFHSEELMLVYTQKSCYINNNLFFEIINTIIIRVTNLIMVINIQFNIFS